MTQTKRQTVRSSRGPIAAARFVVQSILSPFVMHVVLILAHASASTEIGVDMSTCVSCQDEPVPSSDSEVEDAEGSPFGCSGNADQVCIFELL